MYMKLKEGKSKVLTLSYDDAFVQDIRLIEILNRYGVKSTFNLNTGKYLPEDAVREKNDGRMKLSEAKAIYLNSEHEIAIHGLNHSFMDQMKPETVLMETLEDRKNAEKQYGRLVRGMAYPYGTYNQQLIDLLKKCGVCYCRTCKATDWYSFPENWMEWHPTCHHNHPELLEYARYFSDNRPKYANQNWLFFLWGHSYEFDINDNWNVIEDFCACIGGHDDIWYATNIEIYDYVQAYERLQCSADGTIVYNPTTIDVWVMQNENTYCVPSGETILIP